jgi:uncharacterized protein YmfQ (DUF2313 family)
MICPGIDDFARALASLRLRGRAWRNSGTDDLAGSVMSWFFRWQAIGLHAANQRLCALLNEMFCTPRVESTDEWMLDYGLPDACDPYADICSKVKSVGDTTAAYAIAALARRGIVATIDEQHILSPQRSMPGCGSAKAGVMMLRARDGVAWFVRVDRITSSLSTSRRFLVGRGRAGQSLDCDVSLASAECILRRIMPAHADLVLI